MSSRLPGEFLVETEVGAAESEELLVVAVFDDTAAAENQDLIRVANSGEAMSNDEAGPALE